MTGVTLIDEFRYGQIMDATVLPALDQCREEGWMESPGNEGLGIPAAPGRLHYECYDATRFDDLNVEGAAARFRGAIVISHGFTEFARKYSELIWYFLLAGYSVCVLEHRGHGYSARDVNNPSLVWIDDWRRYLADLVRFSETVGQRYSGSHPLFLFAHSMGGGVGAAAIERFPTLFDKAVLSSPMIAPSTGMPLWFTRLVVGCAQMVGLGRHRALGHDDFSSEFDMTGYEGACEQRVRWYHEQRLHDVHYQTYSPTYGWVHEALAMSKATLRQSACDRVETPTLLLQAGRDVWVRTDAQNRFVRQVKLGGGDIDSRRFPQSVHEIFSMPNSVLGPYMDEVLAFLDTPSVEIIGTDEWRHSSRR